MAMLHPGRGPQHNDEERETIAHHATTRHDDLAALPDTGYSRR